MHLQLLQHSLCVFHAKTAATDYLGLVQSIDRLSQGVVMRVADTADR